MQIEIDSIHLLMLSFDYLNKDNKVLDDLFKKTLKNNSTELN